MNWTSFAITCAVIWLATAAGNFLVHGVLLRKNYVGYPNLLRPQEDANKYILWMQLSFAIFAGAFVFLWVHWVAVAGNGPVSAVAFAVAIWLLVSVTRYLIYYTIQPWSGTLVAKQIFYEGVLTVALGLLASVVYRR